jgi:hypothetical protein
VTLRPIVSADGYVENFLADDANRDIRYLVIATRKRLPSRHVQPAPYAVTEIDWLDHRHHRGPGRHPHERLSTFRKAESDLFVRSNASNGGDNLNLAETLMSQAG